MSGRSWGFSSADLKSEVSPIRGLEKSLRICNRGISFLSVTAG